MKKMRKILCTLIVTLLVLSSAPLAGMANLDFGIEASALEASGKCGDNVTYTFDSETGLLTISGTGKMKDYSYSGSPFYYNDDIKSVVIADGVTSVGKYAFYYCVSLESITIPDSVTSIGDYAFRDCISLASVIIGDGVTSIGNQAFCDCSSLEKITVDKDNEYYSSDSNGVLFNKDKTELVVYPAGKTQTAYEIPNSVTSIGDYAFWYCTSLVSVTISDNVTSIGKYTFYECRSLVAVYISDLAAWCNISFNMGIYDYYSNPLYYAKNLYLNGELVIDLVIPESVTNIKSRTFIGCTSLESVTIPDNVMSIGEMTFYGCTSLESVTIGSGVTSIGDEAFACCTSLKSITIPNNVTNIGSYAFYYCTSLENVTISDNITRIGSYAFYECTSLKSVTIPDNVTSIGSYAFYECRSLESITIPDNVTSIGDYAFRDCTSLESITIPDSVTSIGSAAFYNTAYYNNEDNWEGDVLYIGKYLIDAKTSITSCDIKDGTLCIVTDAFRDCEFLASVTIPDSVTHIDSYAFRDCESLASITIGDSVTSIGKDAFYGTAYCNNEGNWENGVLYIGKYLIEADGSITSCDIKDGTLYIAENAFCDCESLKSVIIPDSITSIDVGTFLYCTSLESVAVDKNNEYYSSDDSGVLFNKDKTELIQYPIGNTRISYEIPDGVTSIGEGAFADCTSLASVTIGDSVKSIGLGAFMMCNALASVTIGDSVTSIDEGAFLYCTSLLSLTIGNSVTSIGEMTFYLCDSLTDVYYTGSESDWNKITIGEYNEPLTSATIHYDYVTEDDDHTHTNADPVKENEVDSTCQKAGSYDEVIYCTECGKEVSRKTINLPKLDHDYTSTQVDATCTDDGLITYVCSGCGDTYTETITATDHSYGSWYTATPATVFADGEERHDCKNCDYYETRKLDKLTKDTAKDETTGVGITYTADDFDEVPTVVVSESNEEMENANFILSNFGKCKAFSISLEIDGKKVQPNGTVTVKLPIPAGFEANATSAFYVDKDGNTTELDCYIKGGYLIFDTNHFSVYAIVDKSTEIHVHAHKITNTVDATCTEDGYITYTCSCGDTYDKTIEATGHALGDYTVVENANCTQSGSETANCSNCDYVDTRVIPATGHTFSGSTCTTCGYDRSDDCSCNCHSSGIAHFFFVIVNFFEKLFGNNKVCDCGAAH